MAYKFTPSTLNLLDDCPRCFYLQYRHDLKRPDGIFPSLPSGMDRILKEHFDLYASKDELPPEIKGLKDVKIFRDPIINVWRNNRKGIEFKDEDDNILKGAVDAILIRGKKLIVLDYKTRGYPLKEDTHEHYRNQLNLYNLLLRKNGYETEDYSYLLFYHPNRVIESVVMFNSDLVKMDVDIKSAQDLLKKAISLLDGKMPDASPGCGYCKYRETAFKEI